MTSADVGVLMETQPCTLSSASAQHSQLFRAAIFGAPSGSPSPDEADVGLTHQQVSSHPGKLHTGPSYWASIAL
ncbi:hypothetical protein TREES_T100006217 [Tupaia chinensis]|uniref:Uncharacterized protein n=1 Tax=Tupaia chinensis TaxID=246437 RepID=L9L8T3_TUPCH|nr:hypothetical protein TREES_T100006217 [Tupaia chinensis]